jgi:hypothetical protein
LFQFAIIIVVLFGIAAALVWIARSGGQVYLLWREPVLKRPILILESDDWGPGPVGTAQSLEAILNILRRHHDRDGNHPVMTIALLLAVPDRCRIRSNRFEHYYRIRLDEPRFNEIRTQLKRGSAGRLIALQLHGMEHCWPASLLTSAPNDAEVQNWFASEVFPDANGLPPALQSRWIDGSTLPSRHLPKAEVAAAAIEEVETFRQIFGEIPRVVVPPTFIWTDEVEKAWARCGVRVVVTPGRRYGGRDGKGDPSGASQRIVNGQRGSNGCLYLVRDVYFEPSWGHEPSRVLEAMIRKTREGRPTLVETHRFNFTGNSEDRRRSLEKLNQVYGIALEHFPDVGFMSTADLAEAMEQGDPDLMEQAFVKRFRALLWKVWYEHTLNPRYGVT